MASPRSRSSIEAVSVALQINLLAQALVIILWLSEPQKRRPGI